MSLYRYLPTISDRMAIMWTLLTIEDAVVLEYGPAGTTHFSMGLFGRMGIDVLSDRLFTTHMSEDDVIMGDVERLEKAIVELDSSRHPSVIFVVASAISEVIGTDVIGVCSYLDEEVKAKLVPIENSGFGEDFSSGLKQIYLSLTKKFAKRVENVEPNSYNILGASANSYRIESDINEIQRMLTESFRLNCNCVLGHYSTSEQIGRLGQASLNIVLREEARPTAEFLNKKFGTPYIVGSPYGYIGSYRWLEQVGSILDMSLPESQGLEFAKRLSQYELSGQARLMFGPKVNTPSAVLVGEHYVIDGLAGMMHEFDIEVSAKICNHTLKTISNNKGDCVRFTSEKEQLDELRQYQHHWVLADEVSMHCTESSNTKLCVSPPLIHHSQIARHMPLMGLRGAEYFEEQKQLYIASLV